MRSIRLVEGDGLRLAAHCGPVPEGRSDLVHKPWFGAGRAILDRQGSYS